MNKAARRVRAVVLDFDGVVLRSVDVKTRAFEKLFSGEEPAHVARIVDYYKASGGLPRHDKFHWVYREVLRRPLTEAIERDLHRRYNALVEDAVCACEFVPGAREFLSRPESGRPIYVASGTPEEELRRIVARRGLTPFFAGVYGAPRKKSEILRAIAAELSCAPSELVMVGDTSNDGDAANEAGTRFVGVGEPAAFAKGTRTLPDLRALEEALRP